MPGGLGLTGFAAFGAVKFGGYTAAGEFLNRRLSPSAPPRAVKIGATRFGIGLVAGFLYGIVALFIGESAAGKAPEWLTPVLFLGLLIPVRLLEWFILLRLFFSEQVRGATPWRWMAAGTVLSFALDAVAIGAAFVVPGGIWIC